MNIAIVGGGVTGLFCAHYLMKEGNNVTIIEKSKTGSVTSVYNAGLLTPSLAPTPPIGIRQILSTYLGREDPVYISPRQILANTKWFRRALKSSRTNLDNLITLGRNSLKLYNEFFEEIGFRPDVIEGIAALYKDGIDARMARSTFGGTLLDEPSIRQMGFQGLHGGLMLEDEWSINPAKLYKSLWDKVVTSRAADLVVGDKIELVAETIDTHRASVHVDGENFPCHAVIVTAGSWTRELCRNLHYDPQVLPARGLVLILDTGGEEIITTPALLEDYRVGLTQHNKTTLRITGFFEMVGFKTDFTAHRKKWLIDKLKRHVIKSDKTRIVEEGVGFRPCTPDQLPVIGLVPGLKNTYLASGNCRLGVTLAPATAKLVTSMITENMSNPETTPASWHDPRRFT